MNNAPLQSTVTVTSGVEVGGTTEVVATATLLDSVVSAAKADAPVPIVITATIAARHRTTIFR
ncbi:MAG: hypothetical protein ACMG55_09935, partial [Microcoleus sp.]